MNFLDSLETFRPAISCLGASPTPHVTMLPKIVSERGVTTA